MHRAGRGSLRTPRPAHRRPELLATGCSYQAQKPTSHVLWFWISYMCTLLISPLKQVPRRAVLSSKGEESGFPLAYRGQAAPAGRQPHEAPASPPFSPAGNSNQRCSIHSPCCRGTQKTPQGQPEEEADQAPGALLWGAAAPRGPAARGWAGQRAPLGAAASAVVLCTDPPASSPLWPFLMLQLLGLSFLNGITTVPPLQRQHSPQGSWKGEAGQ